MGCAGKGCRPELKFEAPCILELLQLWKRKEFRLLVLPLWLTVPPQHSVYSMAETNAHGRGFRTKTEGRRVKVVL